MLVLLLALTVLHYSETNISSRPNQLEHLEVDMVDDLGPNHNPRNRSNIEGEEHQHDRIRRSSRITRGPRSRTSTKPRMQWNENMKLALAYIIETEKQEGRWWMRRVEKKWKDSFPMYDMLTLPLPSLLAPFTKGGGGGGGGTSRPPAILKTIAPMNMKFCRVLETPLKVLEMLKLFT